MVHKSFQALGPEYEMHFCPIDLLHFERANSVRRLHFECHSCGFLVYMRKVCSYNGGLTH